VPEQRFKIILISETPAIVEYDRQRFDLPALLDQTIDPQLRSYLALASDTIPGLPIWRAYPSEPRFDSVNGRLAFIFELNLLGDRLPLRDVEQAYSQLMPDLNTRVNDLLFAQPVQGLLSGPIEFTRISVGPG
jgi:hypothetical protein